jgi:cobalt-zinc-cadmium efflux system outer membrane protein
MGRQSKAIRRGVWLLLGALLGWRLGPAEAETPAAPPTPTAVGLDDLIRLAVDRNPALRQAGLDIDAARGRAVQAGLHPNPTVGVVGEEIGKEGGIYTLPMITQEIVTGGKLRLSRAAAERQVDQAFLAQVRQRFALFTAVRQGYFESLSIQRRIEVLEQLIRLADQAYEGAQKLLDAKQIAELDVLPFQVERDRLRGELDAARRESAAARRRLAATVGVPDLPPAPLLGSLEAPLPAYDFEQARAFVLEEHPAIRSARVGVDRARLELRRQEAEPIPNVTVGAGYQRNFNDREDQARYEVGLPLPLFNRNQGNVQAARAELARAVQEVDRVQNDVVRRLAAALGEYDAARERAERYRTSILPNARKAYRLSLEAFRGGQFEYLRVIQAQRAAAEADLEYVRLLGEAWRAAGEISGLLLEECWPAPATTPGQ